MERVLGGGGGEGRYRLRGRRYLGERWSDMPLDIVSEMFIGVVFGERREAYRHFFCKYVLC